MPGIPKRPRAPSKIGVPNVERNDFGGKFDLLGFAAAAFQRDFAVYLQISAMT